MKNTGELLARLTRTMYEKTRTYNLSRRTFLKNTVAYGLEIGVGIAAVQRAAEEIANSVVPKLIPRNRENEIKREIWDRYSILPAVGAQSRRQIIVPLATKTPDMNNPFAEGTWDDATKVSFTDYGWIAEMEKPAKPDILYVQLTNDGSNPRLFLHSDSIFATYNKPFTFGYWFDTMDDGPVDWNENPDDLNFGRGTDPSMYPPNFYRNYDSKYAAELEQDGGFAFSWDFGKSENSDQDHCKAAAEIPIKELLKYPNPKDPSIMAFNAIDQQDLVLKTYPSGVRQLVKGIGESLGEFSKNSANWPQLVLTDLKVPDLSWVDITLIVTLGMTAFLAYGRKTGKR